MTARPETPAVLSALLMWRRLELTLRRAVREEDFLPVLGAAVALVISGTLAYSIGSGWNLVDSFYFAIATLTTSSVADPGLVLEEGWLKLFTAFYVLVGIGILVEVLRRLGMAYVAVRAELRAERDGEATAG